MKRNNVWKWVLTILLAAWALYSAYPPTSRNLLQEFQSKAVNTDTNLTAILSRARDLEKQNPERAYGNLAQAIGTNDITRYFPKIRSTAELNQTKVILNRLQQDAAGKIKLGLDLRGGTSFTVEVDTNRLAASSDKQQIIAQAVEILRKRVDRLGVAEPLIQPAGENKILIALPGLSDADNESARTQIQKAAFLQFRMVHPDSDQMIEQGIPAPGYEVLTIKPKSGDPHEKVYRYLVKIKAERGLTGKNIKTAYVARHPVSNEPEIHFTLDQEGAQKFAEITREFSPRGDKFSLLGIVLDGELYSAPRIMGEIPGGSGSITGSFTPKEAWELANVLENPLEAPVKIIQESRVDPSLGKDSIRSSIMASVIGTVAVVAFMIVYYMFAGLVANVALIFNIIVLFGVMAYVGTTLTIPGIAGIVLTIGMAVDANVLIFERIREELAAGKSMRGALVAGYDKAFTTIFDSNITTLISSVILIYMGTGPVKGFGVTLTIGVSVSFFTALVVTRLIFDWLLDKGWLKTLPMLHLVRAAKIDFMRWAKPAFIATWFLILVGCGYGFYRGGEVMGVDFAGGDTLSLSFNEKERLGVDKIREAVQKAVPGESLVQYQRDSSSGRETLRITVPFNKGGDVKAQLATEYPKANFKELGLEKVGPTVGQEILKTAIVATLLSLFGILVYVAMRYEFAFAVGAVVAIIHDILMTTAFVMLSGRQFSALLVPAILTIIGFSVNDTIVIFDRVREDLKLGVRGTFTELINHALNRTLSRTIITSGTVFLATLAL